MRLIHKLTFTMLIMAALSLGSASLTCAAPVVLLSENFNSENGGQGVGAYSGFAQFIAADVDLLGPGYFFHLCQSAGGGSPCIDMEGNGNGSLTSKTAFALSPGTVNLQFDLAGDQRGGVGNTVTVSLTSILGETLFTEVFSLASNSPFTTFNRTINIFSPTTARLSFASGGRADSYGLLLDNVLLTAEARGTGTNPVPEPATMLLLGTGLASVAAKVRTRRKTDGRETS